jgi:Cft2 family RNA processing exonuclease
MSRHISNVPQTRGWEKKIAEGPPCVVLASPGFMQIGPSRELFELWAPDSRNGLIITGYSVEGTLARVSQQRLLVGFTVYGDSLLFVHNLGAMDIVFPPTGCVACCSYRHE